MHTCRTFCFQLFLSNRHNRGCFLRYWRMRWLILLFLLPLISLAQQNRSLLLTQYIGEKLANRQLDSVAHTFSPGLSAKLNTKQLEMVWLGLFNQFGPLQSVGKASQPDGGEASETLLPLQFERQEQRLLLRFDSLFRVTAFILQPANEADNWRYPAYGRPDSYREFSMKVITDTIQLPAILTLPKNCKQCPVVLFVHGSGPNDKDESQGPNKMFKDLAVGLASKGIASLRYGKRSLSYGPELMEDLRRLTIQTETIEDAANALLLFRKVIEIDTNRIFIFGHGVGAMLAPAIVQQSKLPVRGLILAAPAAKSFAEIVFEQYVHLAARGGFSPEEQQLLKQQEQAKKRAMSPLLQPGYPQDSLPLNLPAEYWLSWQNYDVGTALWQINQPLLVLSGDADYQIPPETLLHLKQKMMGRQKMTYKNYPLLNHFLMPAGGSAGPEDYQRRNNVADKVVGELEQWIRVESLKP